MLTAPELATILESSELAYLAVETATGPMVTPLLFTVRDGRIWMVMPRSSAKVAAIGRNATVGLAAGTPDAMAVLQGEAHLVDPMRPQTLLSSLPETLLSPRALGSYVAGNLDHLAGLIGPGVLTPRTVAALRPQRAVAVRTGAALWSRGDWRAVGAEPYDGGDHAEGKELRLDDVPDALSSMASRSEPVLVGWSTAGGPVVLPGTWDPAANVATVRRDVFRAVGCLPQAPACILFDGTEGTDLDDKTGMVVRGRGSARFGTSHDDTEITVRTERVSWWRGDEARTVKASA